MGNNRRKFMNNICYEENEFELVLINRNVIISLKNTHKLQKRLVYLILFLRSFYSSSDICNIFLICLAGYARCAVPNFIHLNSQKL